MRFAVFVSVSFALLYALLPVAHANGILVSQDPRTGETPQNQSNRGPVQLVSHVVRATVVDNLAQVTVEQTFTNTSDRQLEGVYLFPLPEGAAVGEFAMTMGDRMVEGEVLEARQARQVYEGIVRRRRDPGLLEYVGRGLFRASVFPIEPHGDIVVRLRFQQVLPQDEGTLEWRYPLSSSRFQDTAVGHLRVEVAVRSQIDLKAVFSPTHRLDITRDDERSALVVHEREGRAATRDLVLYLARDPRDVGVAVSSHKAAGEPGTFMTVLAPRVSIPKDQRLPRDVLFVLDTSGSMSGPKLKQAQRALISGLDSLHAGDRFNLITFASTVRRFRAGFVDVDTARAAARGFVGGLEAAGGTNIEGALRDALGHQSDRLALIVFITDGEPTVGARDHATLIRVASDANASDARVFTFGVGHDLDVVLLDKIAETTGGTREYVTPEENLEIVASRFYRKVNEPALANVEVKLGEGVFDVFPPDVGDLFAGEQVVLFGRYETPGPRTITVSATVGDRPVVFEYQADFVAEGGLEGLQRMWAFRKCAFLVDQIRLNGEQQELVDEITRLGTQHGIVTRYTTGLVVEDSELAAIQTDNDLPFVENFGGNRGLSDAPFEGPAQNGTIGISGGAGGSFLGRGGSRDTAPGGGGKQIDDAANGALGWLKAHQAANGSWPADTFGDWCNGLRGTGGRPDGAGDAARTVGVTGLAIQAFLAAGYTNRGQHPYKQTVTNGLAWLKSIQDPEGRFGAADGSLRDQAMATLAMVEAYGMTESAVFKGAARRALGFLSMRIRTAVTATDTDTITLAHAALAWRSAQLINDDAARRGRSAPLDVDSEVKPALEGWLTRVTDVDQGRAGLTTRGDTPGETPTAGAVLIRVLIGEDPRKSDIVKKGGELLTRSPPAWDPASNAIDMTYWYFGSLAAHQIGGRVWKTWKDGIEKAIVDTQRTDTEACLYKGSWDPIGLDGASLGRVGSTARMALCLTVFYRYDRVFGASATTHDPVVRDTEVSERLRDAKGAASADEIARRSGVSARAGSERRIGALVFRRDAEGRWVDSRFDGKTKPTEVEAYSDGFFDLVGKDTALGKVLAWDEPVVIVIDDTPYLIQP